MLGYHVSAIMVKIVDRLIRAGRKSVESATVTLACCSSSLSGLEELVSNTLSHHALPESRQRLLDTKDRADGAVDGVKQELLVEEVASAITACHNADLIVFNLFTCEGYYIAQSMGVACVAVSPFIITRYVRWAD